MRSVSALAVLVAVLFARPVIGQETTREDFEKRCSLMEGRWIGDVTWVTDWPEFGKRGDKVTAYFEGRVTEDGNAVVTKFFGGSGSETGLVYYDAAAKRIHGNFVSSGGTLFRLTIWPDGDKWIHAVDITLPDGTKGAMKNVCVFAADGKTLTIHRNGYVGDDVVNDQKDVWRRVSKSKATDLSPDTARSAAPADDSENITKVLTELSIPWGKAPLTKNTDHLKRILADDLAYIIPDGTVYTKRAFLALYENDTKTYTSAANTAFNVRVYGKNFAVATGDDHYVGKDKDGKPFSNKGRFTNVWVRKNGTWQVVAGHYSSLE